MTPLAVPPVSGRIRHSIHLQAGGAATWAPHHPFIKVLPVSKKYIKAVHFSILHEEKTARKKHVYYIY
jgi:hypothetical protein